MKKSDLFDYQLTAVDWMKNRQSGMLWLGLGGGKTIISLTAIAEMKATALVVSTKAIVESTWPREIDKWEHTGHLRYVACVGSQKQRVKALSEPSDIVGVTYENLVWFYSTFHSQDRFQVIIFDEVSKMKAHNTLRLRIHRRLCNIPRRFGLTATPASESYLGLWGQYEAIIQPNPLGKNITQFRESYVTPIYKGMYTEYKILDNEKRQIEQTIEPHTLVLDIPKRPEPTLEDIQVGWFDPASKGLYKQLENKMVAELAGEKWAIGSSALTYTMCKEAATGFLYTPKKPRGEMFDQGKMARIMEEFEALGGEPVVIFYQFVWERETLLSLLEGSQEANPKSLALFNDGKIPAIIAHPKSAGYGLNLQGSCHHVFWASLPDSATDYIQGNGRVDREGQTRQVVIKRFIRTGTVEEEVVQRLDGKISTMEELIDRVRNRPV